jgi:hypothetical protein
MQHNRSMTPTESASYALALPSATDSTGSGTSYEYAVRQLRLAEMVRDRVYAEVDGYRHEQAAQRLAASERVEQCWRLLGEATRLNVALS